jgi:fumarate reductase (CoM/CoB) subunit A
MINSFTEVDTDVLVVGSGSAGTMAAIKAGTVGADVLLVNKGASNSTKALSGYAAAFGHADPRDNPDVHFADVVRNGVGLCNQKLVRIWVDKICGLTEEMVGWGLDLVRDGDNYLQIPWEGHTYPRMVNHYRVTGKYLMKCLADRSRELQIKTLSHTAIGGLFKTDERVSGAWAFDHHTGEKYLIRAKTVIICSGGLGALYPLGDNVGAVTGEGYSMAFDAGAELIGMEFGHFLPTPIYPEKMQMRVVFAGFINGLLNEGNARLYNGNCERFMFRHFGAQGEKRHSSETLSRSIALEVLEGRGGRHGGIYFDVSDVPMELRRHERYRRMYEVAERGGLDLCRDVIELVTYPHDLVGGIKIDERARTNVPGLYAAGEAAGGSHGASRFGGSALSDCLVFGAIAGEDAARHAMEAGSRLPLDDKQVKAVGTKLDGWLSRSGGVKPADAIERIRALAFRELNMVRNGDGLRRALEEGQSIQRELLPQLCAKANSDQDRCTALREAIEVEGQVKLCSLVATAALERKESRGGFFGGHYRADYPNLDDEHWKKNIVLRNDNGLIAVHHEPVVTLDALSNNIKQVMATAWQAPNDPGHWAESE